jgi:hypothetical protein
MPSISTLTRRRFLISAGASSLAFQRLSAGRSPAPKPLRLAILASNYQLHSEAQKLGDRFLAGYPIGGAWHEPGVKVVSLFARSGDLAESRAAKFGFRIFPTISETLCAGGSEPACDAILLFPDDADEDMFEQSLQLFARSGRTAPIFYSGPLSTSFKQAQTRVSSAAKLGFPLMAGSWLPVTNRLPAIDLPFGAPLEEALLVAGGNFPRMDFHGLEAIQSIVERRRGGESGIAAVQYLTGSQVWDAAQAGLWSHSLLSAALSRSDTPLGLSLQDSRPQDLSAAGLLPSLVPNPVAYVLEYRDGLRATLLLMNGAIRDFNFAARVKNQPPLSFQFFVSVAPNATYASCLAAKVEQMFLGASTPRNIERTLLTCGALEACLSLQGYGQHRLATPHLSIKYQPSHESQYARA